MNQINIISSNWNWQAAAVCIGFNAAAQIFANKFLTNNPKNSTTEKITTKVAGLIIGTAIAIALIKPLASYLAIILTPELIMKMTVVQGITQLAYQFVFNYTTKKTLPPTHIFSKELPDLKDLVTNYNAKWDPSKKEYVGIEYNPERLKERFNMCGMQFNPHVDLNKNHGYIEKKEVPKGAKVFVRADLHGDLKSLIENLKEMQRKGLLDENFKCKSDTYMVFCGDYMDRGNYSLQVAEILATLKSENPDQVFLIRGNHEYLQTNFCFGGTDPLFVDFLTKHGASLNKFYETMPLTLYLAEEEGEFVQFTHGVFELDVDPSNMLESKDPQNNRMVIPKKHRHFFFWTKPRSCSKRVKQIAVTANAHPSQALTKVQIAAKRIMELKQQENNSNEDLTAYNWGDVSEKKDSTLGDLGIRKWRISPQDVKQALRLMGGIRKVKLLFRGHQHQFQHGCDAKGKIVVTTLPVGMDAAGYNRVFTEQPDRAYILEVERKVKNWKKQAFLRKAGETTVHISPSYSVFSKDI